MSEWIKISDRLPEPGLNVLAIFSNGDRASQHYTVYRSDPDADADGHWFWRDSHDGAKTNWFTHWQPLPAPPEEAA